MKRLIPAVAAIAAVLLWTHGATATVRADKIHDVYIVNQTATVTDQAVRNILPAYQNVVSGAFGRAWNASAALHFGEIPPAGAVIVYLNDFTDYPGALGYHTTDDDGVPVARVFIGTSFHWGTNWQTVFGHELFETLADPFPTPIYHNKEVCDAVQSDRWARIVQGPDGSPVYLSDFVYPRWFNKKARAKHYDWNNYTTRPLQVLEGGYMP